MAGSVIATSSTENTSGRNQPRSTAHWIFPRGLAAAMPSAASTAVEAATCRLSDAAHIQTLFGSDESGVTETKMSPCPAAFTLFGASSEDPRSEEHTSELQSHLNLVCRLLLEKKKRNK